MPAYCSYKRAFEKEYFNGWISHSFRPIYKISSVASSHACIRVLQKCHLKLYNNLIVHGQSIWCHYPIAHNTSDHYRKFQILWFQMHYEDTAVL